MRDLWLRSSLLDGYQLTMESGDILGHENMDEVVEFGSAVNSLRVGDRVVVPFTISCGRCWFCQKGLFSCCDRTTPNAELAIKGDGAIAGGTVWLQPQCLAAIAADKRNMTNAVVCLEGTPKINLSIAAFRAPCALFRSL